MRPTADGTERRADTAMGEAFARAGVTGPEVAFRRALALFLNTGGTLVQARAILDAAETQMSADGQTGCAGTGRASTAGRGAGDDGAAAIAPQGHDHVASSAETITREAHRDARGRFVPHPNAVRGMTGADRQALVSVKSDLAKTRLATRIGEFNCLLRRLTWDQVASAGERNSARGLFFAGLLTLRTEGARTVGDCVTDADLAPLVAMAERKASIAFARLMAA